MKTEIELTPAQWEQLRKLAEQQQKSIAELITEAITQLLQAPSATEWDERKQRALSVVGRFPAEPELAQRHDDYLTQEL